MSVQISNTSKGTGTQEPESANFAGSRNRPGQFHSEPESGPKPTEICTAPHLCPVFITSYLILFGIKLDFMGFEFLKLLLTILQHSNSLAFRQNTLQCSNDW